MREPKTLSTRSDAPIHKARPRFLMAELAVVSVVGFALGYGECVEGVSLWQVGVAYLMTQVTYQALYLPLHEAFAGRRPRSFMSDALLVVIPTWLGASWLVGLDVVHAADLAALSLSLVLGFAHIGGFVGGGHRAASWRALYPRVLRRSAKA